jgi:hypothetical protein
MTTTSRAVCGNRISMEQSIDLTTDPRAFAGKLLADQCQIVETLREMLASDSAYLLQPDVEAWEDAANDLSEAWQQMFERFRER